MMTKAKQRFIAIVLAIAVMTSVIVTVNIMSPVSAEASSDFMDIPQITVLTHGLSSSASHWSNYNGSGSGGFVEDPDSLVYKLSQKAGGADIYRAVTYGGDILAPKYKLYEGYTDINNGENNCNGIVDVSKHIIIVFESESSSESNDVVYNEFENMLMDVIDRVQDLNPGGKKPKVNLIGHSRGGITNLQFTLDHPEYVESMISIGTPYFGSPVAGLAGPLVFGENDGMTDINDETIYNDYYTKWTNGYESKYKDINSIAIGATTTIEYQRAIFDTLGGQYSNELSTLLSYYEQALQQVISTLLSGLAYSIFVNEYPALKMFTQEEFIALMNAINKEIHFGTWYGDILVPVASQQGVSEDKNYYFTKYVKEYSIENSSTTPKLSTDQVAVIHNVETYDPDIHNYILDNIRMKDGDAIDTEISNVGGLYGTSSSGTVVRNGWKIKIRNIHEETRTYSYNKKMCFADDARDWTGLVDAEFLILEPGESVIVDIEDNAFATSVAICSINGNTRYIKYANELSDSYDIYSMTTYSSAKGYVSYCGDHGIRVSIADKNGSTWLIELTNNSGAGRLFYYNYKMCYADDAQYWKDLSHIKSVYLSNGDTHLLQISENATATSIVISYKIGVYRYIGYANELKESGGTMVYYESMKPWKYSLHGMTVSIMGKSGNTWTINLTNDTGERRTFEYNTRMCYAGDAEKWENLSDPGEVTLEPGANKNIYISENLTATSIAISYVEDNIRYIFYAYSLNADECTMEEHASSIDTTQPPDDSCLASGTLITLADESQKAVEDLTGDEMLLVWDMETGTFGSAPIVFVDSELTGHYEVITLTFSDDTTVEVISEHGFWDADLNEYVYLDENAEDYIGHSFMKKSGNTMTEVALTDVAISTEITEAYSPVTYGHLCYYVNGMLSMPGGIDGLFNIFAVDPDTLTIDEESYASDIAEYGLYTYEEFSEIFPVSEEVFEAFNGKYLKVAIGKGLITESRISELIERYSEFF